jgi:transcriptional regulator with XRE-family HTH domain
MDTQTRLRTPTAAVAEQVRRHRQEQGISAQQLDERTAELGMRIPRSVLANLENGRRENLDVSELVILGQALGIAPLDLLFPPDEKDIRVEYLPAQYFPADYCAARFTGVSDERRLGRIHALVRELAWLTDPRTEGTEWPS